MRHFLGTYIAKPKRHDLHAKKSVQLPGDHSCWPQARTLGDITADLQEVLRSVLGAPVSPDQPFTEAGVDSLGAAELRNAIAAKFRAPDLPATVAYDYPTVAALAQHLAATLAPAAPPAAAPVLVAAPAAGAVSLARASAVLGLSCRYPGATTGIMLVTVLLLGVKWYCFHGSCIHWQSRALKMHGACAGLAGFWARAAAGADLPCSVPADRWDIERAYSPEAAPAHMTMYTRFGASYHTCADHCFPCPHASCTAFCTLSWLTRKPMVSAISK